jgi:Insertion element 4 transposase N-terminal
MTHDGSGGLSPPGWLPDRVSVGVLVRAFPAELVDQVVASTGTREARRRRLPARLVVYFVLALWLFRGRNCGYGQVMAKLMDGLDWRHRAGNPLAGDPLAGPPERAGPAGPGQGDSWRPPNISSLSRARDKLGAEPLRMLFEQAAGPVGAAGQPGVFCGGLRVISVDGSVADLPATPENEAFFGRPGDAPAEGAFPQVRWVAAAESGTGSLTGAAFGPQATGEPALAMGLLPSFGPGMLVLTGPALGSRALACAILATGAHICWRPASPAGWLPVSTLPDGTYLAELEPARHPTGPSITVRVIEPAVTGGLEPFCLVTDLLKADEYPAPDLVRSYLARWDCAAVTGHYNADMGEGQPVLRSKDPAGVGQEMWALFAVHQAICRVAGAGAQAAGWPGALSLAPPSLASPF